MSVLSARRLESTMRGDAPARALGLSIPTMLLAIADEVTE